VDSLTNQIIKIETDVQGLVLLANPYVSELLQDAIIARHLAVVEVEPLPLRADVRQQIVDDETACRLINTPQTRVFMNSENALEFYLQALQDDDRKQAIASLKDKGQFRQLLADIYPELAYREVSLADLSAVDPDQLRFPLVLKPSIGFFSAGVVIVRTLADWSDAVEDYIEGPEYAIDAFFDSNGLPVLVNAMVHVFPSRDDTRDILYLTDLELVESLRPDVMDLLQRLRLKLDLKDFPFHLEVRRDVGSGRLVPIEVNPYRFAGWGTTDLATFAYGFNVYEQYFDGVAPNLLSGSCDTSTTAFIILHPPLGTRFPEGWTVDPAALRRLLGDVLELRLVDHEKWGILGIAFIRYETRQQAEQAVHLDLRLLLSEDTRAPSRAD
jgi:hypothetical protein